MPKFDGTGPNGKGPKTGRNLGNCPKNKNITYKMPVRRKIP